MEQTPRDSIFSRLDKLTDDLNESIASVTGRLSLVYLELANLAKLAKANLSAATPVDFQFAQVALTGIVTMCGEEAKALSGFWKGGRKKKTAESFNAYAKRAEELCGDITAERGTFLTPPRPAIS